METIAIKENCDDPKERARRAAARKKQKELEAAKQKLNKPVSVCQLFLKMQSFDYA